MLESIKAGVMGIVMVMSLIWRVRIKIAMWQLVIYRAFSFNIHILLAMMVAYWLLGCDEHIKKDTNIYHFTALDSDSVYTINIEGEQLFVRAGEALSSEVVLLAFLQIECANCEMYYDHLSHLAHAMKNVQILGILEDASSQEASKMKDHHEIGFPLLIPTHEDMQEGRSLFTALLAQKDRRSEALLTTNSALPNIAQESLQQKSLQNDTTAQDALVQHVPTQNLNLQDSSMKPAMEDFFEKQMPKDTNSLPGSGVEIPYFVLYDKQHRFYQDYEGIVPEEIFSSDIAQLLD